MSCHLCFCIRPISVYSFYAFILCDHNVQLIESKSDIFENRKFII